MQHDLIAAEARLERWHTQSRHWRIETRNGLVECRVADTLERVAGYGDGKNMATAIWRALDDWEQNRADRGIGVMVPAQTTDLVADLVGGG